MSGDRFNFDETGDTFCCFLVATFTVILLPLTYIFWPASEVKETIESIKRRCQCEHCQIKRASFRSEITRRWLKRALMYGIYLLILDFLRKTIFLVAWAVLFLLILKLSKFEVAKQAFDPFYELSIDRVCIHLVFLKYILLTGCFENRHQKSVQETVPCSPPG